MLRAFYSALEAFMVCFFLPFFPSLVMIVMMTVVSFILFFDYVIVEGDVSRQDPHAVSRDRDERVRQTGASLHEESASRGDETMKNEDRMYDK